MVAGNAMTPAPLISALLAFLLKVIVRPQKTVLGEVCIYRNCAGIVTVGNNN
jgi:hypothetical protein